MFLSYLFAFILKRRVEEYGLTCLVIFLNKTIKQFVFLKDLLLYQKYAPLCCSSNNLTLFFVVKQDE